ncbi:hypothetical protein BECAL_02115 [Bellilinea caldifistulae]|uniref:thermonuclease family protein n=1 Tax=Bellilinea caldifistulae TaxID=360411 RepID=UPI001F400B6F|nr:hypothetical protein [Bellilinea caldifistulae]GAP10937.1 hypothetical protein BECAL_02115 [Bellilinea caldifistulae]
MTNQKNLYFCISILWYLTALVLILSSLGCSQSSTDSIQPTGLVVKFDCIPLPQEPQNAKVVSIIDGDTIKIEIDRQKVNVRYIGINSPELDSNERELAEEALQFNAGLVENQIVTLLSGHFRYRPLRPIAAICIHGRCVCKLRTNPNGICPTERLSTGQCLQRPFHQSPTGSYRHATWNLENSIATIGHDRDF